ncbi:MAG TPA: hypothetical protein VJ901_22855 [Thermoanaerobaculia bacterium]|nr:hypothetical protein [Thermoanaerobaculia bacterium]
MTMLQALSAAGRNPEIPPEEDVYGWLVGDWELTVVYYMQDVRSRAIKGSAHFGWVLEGRAMQDVWRYEVDEVSRTYGTTIRVWDASIQAWRVTWWNPVRGWRDELIGRRVGDELVQIGRHADGTTIRWRFIEITDDSFRWLGEALNNDGETWRLEAEFHGRRNK